MDPAITHQTTTTTSSGGDIDGGPKDPTNIVLKRKRTRRQRPAILTHSSTSYNAFNPSPTSSSDSPAGSTTTEDEDTANCLILLSRGHNVYTINNNNNYAGESSCYKFNSKRYVQTSTDAVNGLTGTYVYECKTCSRTFASFQALGGHRASHRKPRLINEFEKRKPPPHTAFSDDDEPSPQFQSRKNYSSSPSSLSMQFQSKKSSSKLHDCGICGAEFNSGQALGGHMRRHRGSTTTVSAADTATNTTLSLIPYSPVTTVVKVDGDYRQKSTNDGLCLDLDLNLPAPQEISNQKQLRESSFKFTANQNNAPTLVDCHY